MIRWLTLLLVLSLVALGQARATTYYVDYGRPDNSGNGLTTATAWKSAPGMQTAPGCAGATHAYSHVAGDRFIFKGGVSWPAACFGMYLFSGVSGTPDYRGVDVTWFSGASFTRPIWNLNHQVPTATTGGACPSWVLAVVCGWSISNITIDNIEITGQQISNEGSLSASAAFSFNTAGAGVTLSNLYIHDFATNNRYGINLGPAYEAGGVYGAVTLTNSIIDDTSGYAFNDSGTKITSVGIGGGCVNCREVSNVKFNTTMAACFSVTLCHDSEFTGISQAKWDGGSFTWSPPNISTCTSSTCRPHTQVIEADQPSGINYAFHVYNNWIHDNSGSGVTILISPFGEIYNNVFNNNNGNSQISLAANSLASGSYTLNVYNNTVDCSNGVYCLDAGNAQSGVTVTINYGNNLWITNSTPLNRVGNFITHPFSNYTMGTVEAGNTGFTSGNRYKGSPSNTNVRNAGTNLTTTAGGIPGCNSVGATLCSDTQGAPWSGGTPQARPTGVAAWDRGAFVLSGSGPPAVTLLPSSLTFSANRTTTSASQTTRLTNTGGSNLTISSVTTGGLFSQTNDCPFGPPITPGSFCTFTVTFSPNATGPFSGNLTVSDNATGSPHIVPLSGTGTAPVISLSPASYAFGNVVINVPTVSTNFALSNTGDGPLAVHLSTGGADAAFFSVNSACPAILNAGLSCIVQAIFTPLTITSYSGTLVETDPVATGSPTSNALTGSGVAVPLPAPVGLVPWIL